MINTDSISEGTSDVVSSDSESEQTVIPSRSVTAYDSDTSCDGCPPLENIPIKSTHPRANSTPDRESACDFNSSAPLRVDVRPHTLDRDAQDTCRHMSTSTRVSSSAMSSHSPHGSDRGDRDVHAHVTDRSIGPNSRANIDTGNNTMEFSSEITRTVVTSIVELAKAVQANNETSQQNHRVMTDLLTKTNDTLSETARVLSETARVSQRNSDLLQQEMRDLGRRFTSREERQPLREHSSGNDTVTSRAPCRSTYEYDRPTHTTYLGVDDISNKSTRPHSIQSKSCPTFTEGRSRSRSRSHSCDRQMRDPPTHRNYDSVSVNSDTYTGRRNSNADMHAHTRTTTPTHQSQHTPDTMPTNTGNSMGQQGRQSTVNTGHTRLPKFTGDGKSSWKVWHTRFTTVAELHHWDENTCLSELVQHLDGSAADFVFDQISPECRFNYQRLVKEINERFLSEETRKTFRMQFGRRTQRPGESIEDFSAELKRLYDRAYERKDPEIRQQALVDRFLAGLRDTELQFAVEWSKDPRSIEEAVRHVIHYMEARHGHSSNSKSRNVTFPDDSEDSDDGPSPNPNRQSRSPIRQNRYSVRHVANSNGKSTYTTPTKSGENATQNLMRAMEQFLASQNPGKTSPVNKDEKSPTTGRERFANTQCFQCRQFGHMRRDCPELASPYTNRNTGSNNSGATGSSSTSSYRSASREDRGTHPSVRDLSLN